MFYSIIIPTFKRADEVIECLESLTHQSFKDFEIILADGTPGESLEKYVKEYYNTLDLHFLYEEYLGVSEARNLGATKAKGEYFIFLDSDCIFPPDYLAKVDAALKSNDLDAYGGPDAAHASFTVLQKAISYTMTSMLTTGGIRGQKKHVGQFHPRGFNMGISRKAFEQVGEFGSVKAVQAGNDFVVLGAQRVFLFGGVGNVLLLHLEKRRKFCKVVPACGQGQQQCVFGEGGVIGVGENFGVAGLRGWQAIQVGLTHVDLNHLPRQPVHGQAVEPGHCKQKPRWRHRHRTERPGLVGLVALGGVRKQGVPQPHLRWQQAEN